MRKIITISMAAATLFSTGVIAQKAPPDQDHAAHHPLAASAPTPAARGEAKPPSKPAQKPAPAVSAPAPAQVESTMQSMQDMHNKMMAAKTPQERQALMAEHMKAMKDGMNMMGKMRAGQPSMGMGGMGAKPGMEGMHTHHDMMSRRMDMMEMMMQMMMDREAARSTPTQ